MLEEAVCETASGRAEIDGGFSLDWEVEEPESVFELVTAPADETFGGGQLDGIGGADFLARFIGALTIEASEACEDGSLGFFAGIAEPSFDKGEVEACRAGGARRGEGGGLAAGRGRVQALP